MSRAASILMTRDEIRTELGWSEDMIRRLLQIPDAPASIRGKHTSDRYCRQRVLATAQTREARVGISSAEDRRRLYTQIPENTDLLITHGPPYGILDSVPESEVHSGCRELFDAVIRVRPKLHVFGHVHGAHGIFGSDETIFVNAALMSSFGGLDKDPIVLKISRK